MRKYLILALALFCASETMAQKTPRKKIKVKGPAVSVKDARTAELLRSELANASAVELKLRGLAPQYAATITAEDLSKHLHVLASDAYEGRETGEKGQKMAAEYIASFFKENGLVPPPGLNSTTNPYYQTFELERKTWGEVYLQHQGKKYQFLKDFYSLGSEIDQETTLPVVFAGYGIEEGEYSDYKNLDVTGKAVIMLMGEPTNSAGKSLVSPDGKASSWATDWRAKQRLATRKGAKAVIFVQPGTQQEFAQTMERLHHWIEQPTMGLPDAEARSGRAAAFFVSPELGAKLLGTNLKKLEKYRAKIKKEGKVTAAPFKKDLPAITLKAERKRERFTTENVLGYVEGTDLKDEVIIITAHYDHVGIQDGQVYNGADDDGSGTVAVLEMAQAFAKAKAEGNGPRRSLLFMPVTAEEKGLLGSEYYSNNPVFPLEKTVANLNIDMIGRIDEKHAGNPDYVYLIGSDRLSSDLHYISESANLQYTQLKLDYTYNDPQDPNQFYYRSDHYNFAKHGIPVIFYFNGTHEDYHQPTDDVEKIHFPKIEKITRLIFHTAWIVANRAARPVVDKPVE